MGASFILYLRVGVDGCYIPMLSVPMMAEVIPPCVPRLRQPRTVYRGLAGDDCVPSPGIQDHRTVFSSTTGHAISHSHGLCLAQMTFW